LETNSARLFAYFFTASSARRSFVEREVRALDLKQSLRTDNLNA
jgi:hypothetical protein